MLIGVSVNPEKLNIDTDEAIKILNKKLKIIKNGCLKKEYRED